MLTGCSGWSAPGPDHLTWSHIKILVLDENILKLLVWLANACFVTGVWPDYFKTSKTVVIPNPNTPAYNIPKAFRLIVLLNTHDKLFKKVIANRLQWECACYGLLHPCQFGGIRQNSTKDAGSYLIHLVCAGWLKGYKTSIIAFDLAQYFPYLNHSALTLVLDQMGFADSVIKFFSNYFVGRFTRFLWNAKLSDPFSCDMGVGQGSALSPILSSIYLSLAMWAFHTERPDTQLTSYVDDGMIIVMSKSIEINLVKLQAAYSTVYQLTCAMDWALELPSREYQATIHDRSKLCCQNWQQSEFTA